MNIIIWIELTVATVYKYIIQPPWVTLHNSKQNSTSLTNSKLSTIFSVHWYYGNSIVCPQNMHITCYFLRFLLLKYQAVKFQTFPTVKIKRWFLFEYTCTWMQNESSGMNLHPKWMAMNPVWSSAFISIPFTFLWMLLLQWIS